MTRIWRSKTYGTAIVLVLLGIVYILSQAEGDREIEIEIGAGIQDPNDELFYAAQELRTGGEEAKALAAFADILEKHPDTPRAPMIHLYMGSCYVDLGEVDMAVAEYRKIISEYPDFASLPIVLVALGNAYVYSQEDTDALATYQEIIDRWPHTKSAAQAALLRGKILCGQAQYGQAISELENIVGDEQLESDHWKGRLMDMILFCNLRLGDDGMAKKTAGDRANRFALKAEDQYSIASIYFQNGRYSEARDILEQLISQHPDHLNVAAARKMIQKINEEG